MAQTETKDPGATLDELVDETAVDAESADGEEGAEETGDGEPQKLSLEVEIGKTGACQRHITVTVSADDVKRYFDDALKDLMPKAQVPGFRIGRAPRKLVETRFKKEVAEQIKGSLLVDSMTQVNEDHKLAAISEPDLDIDAVVLPDEGPLTFEFDLEVRPDFDLPQWKGLKLDRPNTTYTEKDIDEQQAQMLARYGDLVPFDGPAAPGDYVTCNLTFRHGDKELNSSREELIRIRPTLSFRDGQVTGFDKLMNGVCGGETRQTTARLSSEAPNQSLRGQEVTAVFEVMEVKKLEAAELTPDILEELGEFKSEKQLRGAIRKDLQRRLEYHQKQSARRQITDQLTQNANWELPPELLQRQAQRELERAIMELQRAGFTDNEIRSRANQLRQNSLASTALALKEHFILERIAEDEKIEVEEGDYDAEIMLIALQSGENPRRVRARLEKRGLMDILQNQIVERKVIERVVEHADFKDVPFRAEEPDDTEAIDQSAGGGEKTEIPEAKPGGQSETLPEKKDYT